ncbi:MAG: hypothetical protein WBX18_13405 [Terracidiphilus sp.]
MSDFKGQCFVMQPFDHARYDRLYEQVFDPAIRDAELKPYRDDNDPGASIPIETIEEEIAKSLACFAEISEDNPNVWFELGYALAREKPMCLVCSAARTKFPFDVQHRKIIPYPTQPLRKDYEELKQAITGRLVAVVAKEESRRLNADAASSLSVVPETSGLAPHELLALILIFEDHFSSGTGPYGLAESMKKSGYIKSATNLAVTSLRRKKLVEVRTVDLGGYSDSEDRFFVTGLGEDWLMRNQQKLNLRLPSIADSRSEISEAVHDDVAQSAEISDDDIPF